MGTRISGWSILTSVLLAASLLLASPSARAQAFVGCFKDTSVFDLNGHLERSPQNTPQRCVAVCQARGFAFAAVQYGESCLCGNSYGRYGQASNCDYRCTGDANQVCGGYNANSVFTTGIQIQSPPPPPVSDCAPGPGVECDANRQGSDYAVFDLPQPGPQQCLTLCRNDNSCRAWTYVRPGVQGPGARCYLKNPAPPAVANTCCVSGTVPRIIDQQVAFEVDTDRRGSDYERIDMPVANPDACFDRCRNDGRCAAWTYVRPGVQGPNAVCYLKNPAPAPSQNTCCVSGAIARAANPPPPPPPPPPQGGDCWNTGRTFIEELEGGPTVNWRGVYTRRGNSSDFDAVFTHPDGRSGSTHLVMTVTGDQVRVKRDDYSSVLGSTIKNGVAEGMYDGGTKFQLRCGG